MGPTEDLAKEAGKSITRAGAWAWLAVAMVIAGGLLMKNMNDVSAAQTKALIDQHMRFVDKVQANVEANQKAIDATARAIERMITDTQVGRESAVNKLMGEVSRCCGRR